MDKQTILTAALALARTRGYRGVLKRNISGVLGCGMGTVNYHWGTMDDLRSEIVREAIRTGCVQVVQQAIAHRDRVIWRKNLSPSLRKAFDSLGVVTSAHV